MKLILIPLLLLLASCSQQKTIVVQQPIQQEVNHKKYEDLCNSHSYIGRYKKYQMKDSILTCYEIWYNWYVESKIEFIMF